MVHTAAQQFEAARKPETTAAQQLMRRYWYKGIFSLRIIQPYASKAAQQFETVRKPETTAAQQLMRRYWYRGISPFG